MLVMMTIKYGDGDGGDDQQLSWETKLWTKGRPSVDQVQIML